VFRFIGVAATYLTSKPQFVVQFIEKCPQYNIDENMLLNAGFVPIVQTLAGIQYVPTNALLMNTRLDPGNA